MNHLLAILLYALIIFTVMQNWVWLMIILTVVFSLRYQSVALIPLAIFLDGYYGAFYMVPVLSIAAIVWYVFIEFLKPKLIFYRQ